MYHRELSEYIKQLTQFYPIISIMGPKQSGKTTLAKQLFPHLPYISLENLDVRREVENDPRKFLNEYSKGVIIDETHNVPDLFSYLQRVADESIEKGKYVLINSQNVILNPKITQSLAGRVGIGTLLPLSLSELGEESKDYNEIIFKGGYPKLHKDNIAPEVFYPVHNVGYIERDVCSLINSKNIRLFHTFIKMCANRIGHIVNFSSLAEDIGISNTTAKEWMRILVNHYIIFLMGPFYDSFGKRLIKMPKLYFHDTGLACYLLEINSPRQISYHSLRGGLFENLVILEMAKKRINNGLPPNLYFWRDKTGHEIDCIAAWEKIKAIEIKSGQTFQKDFIKNLQYVSNLGEIDLKYLLYAGKENYMYEDVNILPLDHIYKVFED